MNNKTNRLMLMMALGAMAAGSDLAAEAQVKQGDAKPAETLLNLEDDTPVQLPEGAVCDTGRPETCSSCQ